MQWRSFSPRRSIRKYVAAIVLATSIISCAPRVGFAASDDEDTHYDARVRPYADPKVELPSSGSGGCWLMLILMAVGCVGVIFKDAKRTHLD